MTIKDTDKSQKRKIIMQNITKCNEQTQIRLSKMYKRIEKKY